MADSYGCLAITMIYVTLQVLYGELEMDIVCILPSKRKVPTDVAVTIHQVPNCKAGAM